VSGTSILVVDDDAAICRVLARALAAEGYVVTTASDGGGALVELERRLPDLMLLDVSLPGLDGLAVARRARA
jgi:two-component system response regulator MprA